MDKLWYLSTIDLFNYMSQDEMAAVELATTMSTIPADTIVQAPYSKPKGLYLVKRGQLRLYTLNDEGKQYTAGILGKGSAFGDTSYFSLGTKDYYIETISDTLICTFPSKDLEVFLLDHPTLLMTIMKSLSNKIEDQNRMLKQLALYDVKERLLFWISKLALSFGSDKGAYIRINLNLSHQELANMIGATRESVSLSLRSLVAEGTIISGRMKISILKDYLYENDFMEEGSIGKVVDF